MILNVMSVQAPGGASSDWGRHGASTGFPMRVASLKKGSLISSFRASSVVKSCFANSRSFGFLFAGLEALKRDLMHADTGSASILCMYSICQPSKLLTGTCIVGNWFLASPGKDVETFSPNAKCSTNGKACEMYSRIEHMRVADVVTHIVKATSEIVPTDLHAGCQNWNHILKRCKAVTGTLEMFRY
jgi:hypothetical protein